MWTERPDLTTSGHARTRDQLQALELLLEDHSTADRKAILSAANWMLELHWDQSPRPDGTPYVQHPLEVCLNVIESFGFDDVDVLVAALLHDAVEDQAAKMVEAGEGMPVKQEALKGIEGRYGARAAKLVDALTNPDWSHINDKAVKNQMYREHFRKIAQHNPMAFAIKLADFSTNALRLDQVKDKEKFEKLARKYCPVMGDAMDALSAIPSSDHPLSRVRQYMLPRLEEALASYCSKVN